ncbi:hypothetical protein MVEN_02177700 [Mycena venus]|uniref:Uncharacterized protein n=1 Tax=Mycena venus TaxID=2733690 RepID=A0A8H7CG09_9AGAR|nr:hypothetical protein MVEN_02177700 [Mycena venus]
MFSIRFIALVVTSIATLSSGNIVPSANKTSQAPEACSTSAPLEGTLISACLDDNFGNCDSVPVVDGGCTHMPLRQINAMSSVTVPCGWVCTFYDTNNECDATNAVSITTIVFPGSSALSEEDFDNVVDYVQCNIE